MKQKEASDKVNEVNEHKNDRCSAEIYNISRAQ